jgi:integrase
MDAQWGNRAGRTYNKNLSILRDFIKFQVLRGRLHGGPTLPIERAKKRAVLRTTFTSEQRLAILASQTGLRDKVALRLLLDYGIRKGSLQAVRFQHFDHLRKRLVVFAKGGTIRELPIPHQAFWLDLERVLIELETQPDHYLLCRQRTDPPHKGVAPNVRRYPEQPMGVHDLHDWWYDCLQRAGIVPEGVTSGKRMHKARHSAWPARPRPDRELEGRPEVARPRVDPDDRRHLHRLGHRPARQDAARGDRRMSEERIVPADCPATPLPEPKMEAAGIEPAQGSLGSDAPGDQPGATAPSTDTQTP